MRPLPPADTYDGARIRRIRSVPRLAAVVDLLVDPPRTLTRLRYHFIRRQLRENNKPATKVTFGPASDTIFYGEPK